MTACAHGVKMERIGVITVTDMKQTVRFPYDTRAVLQKEHVRRLYMTAAFDLQHGYVMVAVYLLLRAQMQLDGHCV